MTIKNLVFCALFLTGLSACLKKEEFTHIKVDSWEPSVALPLVNSTLTLKDIVDGKKVNIQEGPDGLYTFVYQDTAESPSAEELIQIPNQSETFGITFPDFTLLNPFPEGETESINNSGQFNFALLHNAQLKYIDLKSGMLLLDFESSFKHNAKVTLTIHSLVKNGQPLQLTLDLNYQGTSPVRASRQINLTGYRVDLSDAGTTTNHFEYSTELQLTSKGGLAPLPGESVDIDLNMEALKFSLLYGDPGVFPMGGADGNVNIDVFDRTVIGDLHFEEPKVTVTFDNSFGVPASIQVNKLETVTTDGEVTPVSSTAFVDSIPLNYPSATEIGMSKTTVLSMDKNNSNIQSILKSAPHKLNYAFGAKLGASGTEDRFIADNSRIKVYAEVEIPIYGTVRVYALMDTLDIELPEREYVESAQLKLKVENQLPVDVKLQLYFLDMNSQVIDSLFTTSDNIIVSGVIDQSGKVVSPGTRLSIVELNKLKYDRIAPSTKVLVRGELATSKNATESVKIYSYYTLQLQLALKADAKVKFD